MQLECSYRETSLIDRYLHAPAWYQVTFVEHDYVLTCLDRDDALGWIVRVPASFQPPLAKSTCKGCQTLITESIVEVIKVKRREGRR
jgi:hypothetical protein